jgi:dsRNA-specific ribonuclease
MKSCLTSRVTHAYLGYHLGLYQKLKGSALDAQESQRQSQDLAADAFEAYVGALCKQDLAKRWLKSVWSPNVLPGLKDLGRAAGPVIQTQQPQKAKEKVVKKKLAKQVQAVAIKSKGSQKAGGKKGQPAIGKKVKKGGNGGAQQTQKPADVKQTQQGKVDAVKREVVVKQER